MCEIYPFRPSKVLSFCNHNTLYSCFVVTIGTEWTQLLNIYNWSSFQVADDTVEKLFNEGFDSLLSISCIREDDLKYLKKTTGISLGQIVLLREAINALQSATLVEDTVPVDVDNEGIEPPQQISPMEVVIPVRMDVSPEQAAMLQGSPSPPAEASGEPSGQNEERSEGERSEGEGSGSEESSEEEESGDEGSDDDNDD